MKLSALAALLQRLCAASFRAICPPRSLEHADAPLPQPFPLTFAI